MTVMNNEEKGLNLGLAGILAALGYAAWFMGLRGTVKGFILPDYASVLQGAGGVVALIGMIWLAFALLRSKDALINLAAAALFSLLALTLWLTAKWMLSRETVSVYADPFLVAGRNSLAMGLVWLFASVVALLVTTPGKRTR